MMVFLQVVGQLRKNRFFFFTPVFFIKVRLQVQERPDSGQSRGIQ